MATETASPGTIVEDIPRKPTMLGTLGAFCRGNPLGAFGGFIVIAMCVMAVFAPLLTSYDPTANDFGAMLSAPDLEHWLSSAAISFRASSTAPARRSSWASCRPLPAASSG